MKRKTKENIYFWIGMIILMLLYSYMIAYWT